MGQDLGHKRFLVVDHKDQLVCESDDISEARIELHRLKDGSRVIRRDGVVLAFMASEGSAKVRKRLSKSIKKYLHLKPSTATG